MRCRHLVLLVLRAIGLKIRRTAGRSRCCSRTVQWLVTPQISTIVSVAISGFPYKKALTPAKHPRFVRGNLLKNEGGIIFPTQYACPHNIVYYIYISYNIYIYLFFIFLNPKTRKSIVLRGRSRMIPSMLASELPFRWAPSL